MATGAQHFLALTLLLCVLVLAPNGQARVISEVEVAHGAHLPKNTSTSRDARNVHPPAITPAPQLKDVPTTPSDNDIDRAFNYLTSCGRHCTSAIVSDAIQSRASLDKFCDNYGHKPGDSLCICGAYADNAGILAKSITSCVTASCTAIPASVTPYADVTEFLDQFYTQVQDECDGKVLKTSFIATSTLKSILSPSSSSSPNSSAVTSSSRSTSFSSSSQSTSTSSPVLSTTPASVSVTSASSYNTSSFSSNMSGASFITQTHSSRGLAVGVIVIMLTMAVMLII